MRYHVLATDYDGTLASDGKVFPLLIEKLQAVKASGRKVVLVTGREMRYLVEDFPEYKVFDHIVAENGAVLHDVATGKEVFLGPPPDPAFVQALINSGVAPISVGSVIIATWEPHEQEVLQVIKASGIERQVIFNKAAVMILPNGINKSSGLSALLKQLQLSPHNCVAVGDAENDSAMLTLAECGVAVANALPSVKGLAAWTTDGDHGAGVAELIDRLLTDDLQFLSDKLTGQFLDIGTKTDETRYLLNPYRSGILLSGVTGGGKTTFTLSFIEALIAKQYQFCLIDPEGDYLELSDVLIVGDEKTLPPVEEIMKMMQSAAQNIVICILSVPILDRPAFFGHFVTAYHSFRQRFGHPHWLLLDEAHHLLPISGGKEALPDAFHNFLLISTATDKLNTFWLEKTGSLLVIGSITDYPFRQYCAALHVDPPKDLPSLQRGEICVWERQNILEPFIVRFHLPKKLLQRHKRKYAQGDMAENSFVFTGPENKLHLVANNLILFMHIAEGIDDATWVFHNLRADFTKWIGDKVHDEGLVAAAESAEQAVSVEESKKILLGYIRDHYTA